MEKKIFFRYFDKMRNRRNGNFLDYFEKMRNGEKENSLPGPRCLFICICFQLSSFFNYFEKVRKFLQLF